MDKAEFIKQAPLFYALAIAALLNDADGAVSERALDEHYTTSNRTCLIDDPQLRSLAMEWLHAHSLIRIRKASFGPPLFYKSETFEDTWEVLLQEEMPFSIYGEVDEQHQWLSQALYEIRATHNRLRIQDEDYTQPSDDWAPIQLDTSQPAFNRAVEDLDKAIADIRADNGYAATFPEEREYVIDGLQTTVSKLQTGSIAAGYIKDAWEKLTIVGRRFSGAALELVALGAKQAIIDFVKQQGGELLRALGKMISGG
jgi:hypothetical protein